MKREDEIREEIASLGRLAKTCPDDAIAQASTAGQANVLSWVVGQTITDVADRIDELMTAIHVARGALFNIGGEYAFEVAAKLGETLERAAPAILQKRPIAWRVQGDEFGEWLLYDNEKVARQEAESRDVQYQGLYARTEE